jgi:hypothetical protein
MIDYNLYKKFYSQGDEFTLEDEKYKGYVEVIDGIPVSFPGRRILNPIQSFNTDIKLSKTQYDRLFEDILELPHPVESIYIQPNDYLTYELFVDRLDKMHENNSYLFSRMFMPNNNSPRVENSSFVGSVSDSSVELQYYTNIQPVIPFRRLTNFNTISEITKQVVERHKDLKNIFVSFAITDTQFITLSSDKNNTDITTASTFFETKNNKLSFKRLSDICVNNTHAFIVDKENKYVFKYNIESYLETDPALSNTKHYIEAIGDESDTNNTTRFDAPSLIACTDTYIAVYDEIRNNIRIFDTSFNFETFIANINLKREKVKAIQFNPLTENLYVITSDSNGLKLYVYDSLFELRDSVALEEILKDDEDIKNIMFSFNDSNTWYIVTNHNVYRKLINRPGKIVGVLQRDNMLLNTDVSFIGDRWFTYTTNITRCESLDHIISEFNSVSALQSITITEDLSARDERVLAIAINSPTLGSIENNFEVYLNNNYIGNHNVTNKTTLFISGSSTNISTISGMSFDSFYQTASSNIDTIFFDKDFIQQGSNNVVLRVPIGELTEKNTGSITSNLWVVKENDLINGIQLANRQFVNSFSSVLSSTFLITNVGFDEINISETTISNTLSQILTADPLSLQIYTISLSVTATNEICTSFFELDSDFTGVLPTSNFWNFINSPFNQSNFLWNSFPESDVVISTVQTIITPPFQYYRIIMYWDEQLKNVRGGEATSNVLNPDAATGIVNVKFDTSNSSTIKQFNGFRDIRRDILLPFSQSTSNDILTQTITDQSFIKTESILNYNIKTYNSPLTFIGFNNTVYKDIHSVFISDYDSSVSFANTLGFNLPGWVPTVVSDFANENNAYVEIDMTIPVSLSGIRILAEGSTDSKILPPKYIGILGSNDGITFTLTASAEMPDYQDLSSTGSYIEADIVPQITRTLNNSFPYTLSTNTTLLSTLSTSSTQLSPASAFITETQNISSINYFLSGFTFENGYYDTVKTFYTVTVDVNTSNDEQLEDDVFVCGSVVESTDDVDDIIFLTNNRISFISEPVTFTRILKDLNYANYGRFNITLNPDEYIQHSTINKELYKVISDLYDIRNNVVGRFSGTRLFNSFLMDLNGYNYNIEEFFPKEILTDFFLDQSTDFINSYVYENEKSIVGVLNRAIENIYTLQSIIFNLTKIDTGTDLLPVNGDEETLIID